MRTKQNSKTFIYELPKSNISSFCGCADMKAGICFFYKLHVGWNVCRVCTNLLAGSLSYDLFYILLTSFCGRLSTSKLLFYQWQQLWDIWEKRVLNLLEKLIIKFIIKTFQIPSVSVYFVCCYTFVYFTAINVQNADHHFWSSIQYSEKRK